LIDDLTGGSHTQANFETAFWRSAVADNRPYEQWNAEGSLDAAQRANAIWKKMLREYEAPALDPSIDEALQAYMAKRKKGLPDSVS
jgi:trimethylamine---corrinoid protein Co-methyltransferase